jgi:hypothetical protein
MAKRPDAPPLTERADREREHDIDRIVEIFKLSSLAISNDDAVMVRTALRVAWASGRAYLFRYRDEADEMRAAMDKRAAMAGNGGTA